MADREVVYLETLQFSWGGLFDSRLADGGLIHLVEHYYSGAGPALCGIDRHAKDSPGWSLGGGLSGPNIPQIPCEGCVAVAKEKFADLPIGGGCGSKVIAEAIGTDHYDHGGRVPAIREEQARRRREREAARS